jgi:hypothetical protein
MAQANKARTDIAIPCFRLVRDDSKGYQPVLLCKGLCILYSGMKSLLMVYEVIRRKYQQQRIPVPLNGMQRCQSYGRGSIAAFRLKDNGKKNVVCPRFSIFVKTIRYRDQTL